MHRGCKYWAPLLTSLPFICLSDLFREAPRAKMMGSVISTMDCSMEVTTMNRMMLRRKVRCRTCMSNSSVWTASNSRVTPSVTPLARERQAGRNRFRCTSYYSKVIQTSSDKALFRLVMSSGIRNILKSLKPLDQVV